MIDITSPPPAINNEWSLIPYLTRANVVILTYVLVVCSSNYSLLSCKLFFASLIKVTTRVKKELARHEK